MNLNSKRPATFLISPRMPVGNGGKRISKKDESQGNVSLYKYLSKCT